MAATHRLAIKGLLGRTLRARGLPQVLEANGNMANKAAALLYDAGGRIGEVEARRRTDGGWTCMCIKADSLFAAQAIVGTVQHGEGVHSKTADDPMRCRARTWSGGQCRSLPVRGKKRCRMHGGAHGSGAPSGERNGMYRHGRYTREALELRRAVRELVGRSRETIAAVR